MGLEKALDERVSAKQKTSRLFQREVMGFIRYVNAQKAGVTLARGFGVFLFCTAIAARLLNFKSATFLEFLFFTFIPTVNRAEITNNPRPDFTSFTTNRHCNLLKKWEKFYSSNPALPWLTLNLNLTSRTSAAAFVLLESFPITILLYHNISSLSTKNCTISSIFLEKSSGFSN